jgi:hypothetical protein
MTSESRRPVRNLAGKAKDHTSSALAGLAGSALERMSDEQIQKAIVGLGMEYRKRDAGEAVTVNVENFGAEWVLLLVAEASWPSRARQQTITLPITLGVPLREAQRSARNAQKLLDGGCRSRPSGREDHFAEFFIGSVHPKTFDCR